MPHGRHRARRRTGPALAVAAVALVALGVVAGVTVWRSTVDAPPTLAAVQTEGPQLASPGSALRSPSPPAVQEPLPPRFPNDEGVLLIGDSLAVGIAEPLSTSLPEREVTVEAEEGRRTDTSVALVADHASVTPSIWLVSLGTNDNPEEFADDAESLLSLAGPDRCVLWFDVHRSATDSEINAVLTQLEGTHPNLELLDWQQLADAHPEWFSVDDIHPDTSGYQERAQLADSGISRACTEQ